MKRVLLKQIGNEWKTNVWMVLEMAVVIIAVWFIWLLLYDSFGGLLEPRGFEPDDVAIVESRKISETSPEYIPYESNEEYGIDLSELVKRIKENPVVEAVTISQVAPPYSFDFMGNNIFPYNYVDSVSYYGNLRYATPDIAKVLSFKSKTGKTTDQLVELLKENKLLIGTNSEYVDNGRNPMDLIGQKVIMNNDSSNVFIVGDVIDNVRRSDYENSFAGTIIYPIFEDTYPYGDVFIKVKKGKEKEFIDMFNSDLSLHRQRNTYLANIQTLNQIRKDSQLTQEIDARLMIIIMFFLLITVFLGLLGSFWFRVQQRVSELAIRKVFGATKKDIFRRVIGEGLLLLTFASLLVSAAVWPFIKTLENGTGVDWWVFLVLESIAIALLVICIVVSLWYPAWRSMKIGPAIAVKAE